MPAESGVIEIGRQNNLQPIDSKLASHADGLLKIHAGGLWHQAWLFRVLCQDRVPCAMLEL